ncbi:MAG: hypothetical protein ACD_23C00079G0001 [uncultured bacterium]|nr:MAG: hypothetical protein ACD_23C00079G0001 [uncultured bacterium]
MIRARASAARLTMPPDRSAGILWAADGSSPTMRNLTMATSLIRSRGRVLSSRRAKAMLSSTLKAENRAPC